MKKGIFAITIAASLAATSLAPAAGLYFSDRGVRPVGRAGAFVAGADDLGALWYNPAGVAFAGDSLLADASWLRFGSSFQRRTVVQNPDGSETTQGANYFPEVNGTSPLLPLPTLAISNSLGAKDWNFAFGVLAPYSALTTYPENQLAFGGRNVPAPQRYSLTTLNGSALAVLTLNAAYRPTEHVAIGFGVQMLTGNFVARKAITACPPDRFVCNSEQPDYDGVTSIKAGPIFAPSGNLGIIGIVSDSPTSEVRLGAMFQLPFWVNAPAKTTIQLPSAAIFRNASVEGEDARVKFRLPPIFRAGIETRFGEKKATRIEGAFFYEAWSMHDSIKIEPTGNGIQLKGVTGFPETYQVGALEEKRGFRDTFSVHAGVEHTLDAAGYPLTIRGGVSYERSAVPPSNLSVLTVDLDKVQLALGGSLYVGEKHNLRLDLVIAHTFGFTTDVDPHDAAIGHLDVVRSQQNPDPESKIKINGGRYTAQADVVGVGLNWKY